MDKALRSEPSPTICLYKEDYRHYIFPILSQQMIPFVVIDCVL